MVSESQDELDRRIRELEREKREEELRQLKATARIRWVTPTVLVALLPLMAGFGLWVFGEIKQYNAGYAALKERDKLQQEKEALQRQKDSLNVEIGTLIQLKEHYAGQARQLRAEVEAKQDIMDKTYLRAVAFSSESIYALDHVKGMGPGPDRKALESIKADLKQFPKEAAAGMQNVLRRYELMGIVIDASRGFTVSFQKALALIPASDWTRLLQPMPTGSVISGRSIMFSDSADGRRYYDVTEGRFLTKEEAKEAR